MKTTNPQPPHLTPGWFMKHATEHEKRLAYYRELGPNPELCPNATAATVEYRREVAAALQPVFYQAEATACDARQRLGVRGEATLAHTWRLAHAESAHVVIKRRGECNWSMRIAPGVTQVDLAVGYSADEELKGLSWGLGMALCVEPHPGLSFVPGCSLGVHSATLEALERIANYFAHWWRFGCAPAGVEGVRVQL